MVWGGGVARPSVRRLLWSCRAGGPPPKPEPTRARWPLPPPRSPLPHYIFLWPAASLPTKTPLGKPKGVYANRIVSLAPPPKVKAVAVDPVERDDFGDPVSAEFTWDAGEDAGTDWTCSSVGGACGSEGALVTYGAEDEALAAALAAADAVPEDPSIIKYGLGEYCQQAVCMPAA